MTESAAPLGYDTAAEITFRVNKDGIVEVKQGNGWVNAVDAKIQMVDELKSNKVKFSKVTYNKAWLVHSWEVVPIRSPAA